jgi:enoyl-CoA hydratase
MSTESAKTVSLEVRAGVAIVTVSNPPVNAITDAVLGELEETAAALAVDDSVRAVVVTGAGEKAFMAGADLAEFVELLDHPEEIEHHTALTARVFGAWAELRQPVIAAVQASAVGGGLEFALVCDFIVADPRARFASPEIQLGLMPGAGATQRLPRRIGTGEALEMLMLGGRIDAARAQTLGLVNRVSEEGEAAKEAIALAERLASLPALAVQAIKEAVSVSNPDLPAGLAHERQLFHRIFASEDFAEGATAFLEKRVPVFTHR